MVDIPQIPQDDIMDVLELTLDLEDYIIEVLADVECELAVSALMGATVNCLLGQCKTMDQVLLYRSVFIEILDNTIRNIEIKEPEAP